MNPNFTRYDLLKINDKVLFTLEDTLNDGAKHEMLTQIFKTVKEMNVEAETDDLRFIKAVGKLGAT
jgi:hypothetical protein